MKYHAENQISRIARLQEDARVSIEQARLAIEEADQLTTELKTEVGSLFVCKGVAYRLEHRAIGFLPGNRDWLVRDSGIKVIE